MNLVCSVVLFIYFLNSGCSSVKQHMSYLKNKLCLVSLKESLTVLKDEFQKKVPLVQSNLAQMFHSHGKLVWRFILESLSFDKPLHGQAVLNKSLFKILKRQSLCIIYFITIIYWQTSYYKDI